MFYFKLTLAAVGLSIYSFFLLKPFIGEISELETKIDILEKSKERKVEVIKKCKESRDNGTKRFIDYFDEEIDNFSNKKEESNVDKNQTLPSWSSVVLGIKGNYEN